LNKKKAAFEASKAKVVQAKQDLEEKLAYKARADAEIKKLEDIENAAENKEALGQLRSLVLLNETLKLQEAQFKGNCKQQRDELMDMLRKLENDDGDEETKKMKEVERIYGEDKGKLDKINLTLASKLQQIAKVNREIDDIPTRAELMQYERRFVELYELVADKLVETRKYYAMYNTLDDSLSLMTQEVSLLNSIVEGFPIASKSKGGQTQFLEKFGQILEGIEKTKEQKNKELQAEKTALEALTAKYNKLVEKQRNYFKAVKEFQEECYKNEKYQEAMQRFQKAEE